MRLVSVLLSLYFKYSEHFLQHVTTEFSKRGLIPNGSFAVPNLEKAAPKNIWAKSTEFEIHCVPIYRQCSYSIMSLFQNVKD